MKRTRYIKFDFHDNDFMLSTADTIKTVFCNELFNVVMSNDDHAKIVTNELMFSDRWEEFEHFLNGHYRGDVDRFARRLSTIMAVSHYIYHNLMHEDYCDMNIYDKEDIKDNEAVLKDIENELVPRLRIDCDISFANDIDKDEDWNGETIYLDMHTGIMYLR